MFALRLLKKRNLKVTFNNPKVTNSYPKLTYSGSKVTYSGPKVNYSGPKVTYSVTLHIFPYLHQPHLVPNRLIAAS